VTVLRLTRRGRAVCAILLIALALLLALWLAPNRGGMSMPPYLDGAEIRR